MLEEKQKLNHLGQKNNITFFLSKMSPVDVEPSFSAGHMPHPKSRDSDLSNAHVM